MIEHEIVDEVEIAQELAGLLPTLPARPTQFDHCNRCPYAFKKHDNGVVDMRDVRLHKAACRPTSEELFPTQAHTLRRFPELLQQQRVPIAPVGMITDTEPYERRNVNMEVWSLFGQIRNAPYTGWD